MGYRFRLEAVLDYRRNLEELAQQKLASEEDLLKRYHARLRELRNDLERLERQFVSRTSRPVSASLFSLFSQALELKKEEITAQEERIVNQQQAVARARKELVGRVKARKIMEKVREKDYEQYCDEQRRLEQQQADEQVVLRYRRKEQGLVVR